jgi:hypothetical protein
MDRIDPPERRSTRMSPASSKIPHKEFPRAQQATNFRHQHFVGSDQFVEARPRQAHPVAQFQKFAERQSRQRL